MHLAEVCYVNIRRPRQTHGGARQGIRHLTLVEQEQYCYCCYSKLFQALCYYTILLLRARLLFRLLLLLRLLRVPSGSLMLAAWSHQTTFSAAGDKKRDIFSRNSEGALAAVFVGKFEHGFGTQVGFSSRRHVFCWWRGVPSASLMLAAWSHQSRRQKKR